MNPKSPNPAAAEATAPAAAPAAAEATSRAVALLTDDNITLSATLFEPATALATRAAVISTGTGFPQRIYARFARYLVNEGYAVLTYDYRDMGASRIGPASQLKTSEVEYIDWGRKDLDAALGFINCNFPTLPLDHIAHSVGGHMVGFAANNHLIARQAFVGVGMGAWWQMAWWFRLQVFFMLWVPGPISLWTKGYIPKTSWGWTGEPLPPRVFKQWRHWCSQPNYFEGELMAGELEPSYFGGTTAPIRSFAVTDDEYVTPTTTHNILRQYSNADVSQRWYKPGDLNQRKVGHSNYFKPGLEPLWRDVVTWLKSEN